MKIGVPKALLFHRYEPYIKIFFDNLNEDIVYSGPTNRVILEKGINNCVDEACLPIKVFQGHVTKLLEECDKVVVPRIMKCEFGDSICPKFAGLPELIGKGDNTHDRFIFTNPLYLNDKKKLKMMLVTEGKRLGIRKHDVMNAFNKASKTRVSPYIIKDSAEQKKKCFDRVMILGHPYNIYDNFVNMNMAEKLKSMGVEVIYGDSLDFDKKLKFSKKLIKEPYWMFYRENLWKAITAVEGAKADGIIYISSFCCGTDSITIDMIKDKIGGFPMLVIKLDEHTGEVGVDTRLEAFVELLERRKGRKI